MSNQRARNVPQNEAQTNYVPHVPQMRYSWGTKTSSTLDGDKFTDFYYNYYYLPQVLPASVLPNQRARNVPQNEVQTNYVPHVPQMRYTWGTKTRTPQDENKFTDFWVDLMKIWFFGKIWHFHSMDFLDGVKGQN